MNKIFADAIKVEEQCHKRDIEVLKALADSFEENDELDYYLCLTSYLHTRMANKRSRSLSFLKAFRESITCCTELFFGTPLLDALERLIDSEKNGEYGADE